MKAIFITLVFAFALTANCGLLKQVSNKAPVLALAQIDQHPLGKSLLSLMQLHMKAQGPIQDLPILMQQIYDDLSVQYQENENTHDRNVAYCAEEIARYRQNLGYHGKQYGVQQTVKVQSEKALVELRAKLADLIARTEENERRTAEGTAQREHDHAIYESDIADNIDAIDASTEAINLLNALRAGTSFVQLKNKFQKVSDKLDQTKSAKHGHIYTPIIKALAQISSKADKEAIGRILELLTSLLAQLQSARATIEETEVTQASLWAQELSDLTAEHAILVSSRAETEDAIEDREETLASAIEQMANHIIGVESNAQNLKNQRDQCAAWEEAYQTVRAELEREQEIVAALQDHFDSKLAGLQGYIDSAPAAF
jgi:hypothetical protein